MHHREVGNDITGFICLVCPVLQISTLSSSGVNINSGRYVFLPSEYSLRLYAPRPGVLDKSLNNNYYNIDHLVY